MNDLVSFLAAAMAKHGMPIEVTEAEIDQPVCITLKTTPTGAIVGVRFEELDED